MCVCVFEFVRARERGRRRGRTANKGISSGVIGFERTNGADPFFEFRLGCVRKFFGD